MMKKFGIQLSILLTVIFFSLYLAFNPAILGSLIEKLSQPSFAKKQIGIDSTKLTAEVADTPGKRAKGLGGRESLASDSAMLFVFEKKVMHSFWMKGMKFPLDFIYLGNGRVVDLKKNIAAPDPSTADNNLPIYNSGEIFDMMLEVNSGFIDAHEIKIGDPLTNI